MVGADGRVMALDVGERTIGVALSDPERRIASPFTTIRRATLPVDLSALEKIIEDQEVVEVVVGMPRSLSGDLHFQAEQTGWFVDALRAAIQMPIKTWDERFSTAEADRALIAGQVSRSRRKQIIDQTAAALILQAYLAHQQEAERKA
ncbi:MAG TPA: Holliday junction resolvase RuvX [Armatimonadota bacterium]|nr:Holliday junction resolvase RuvX [Armatimonadota bacterium]